MAYMATLPDKAFELAIVDPPYGLERFRRGSLRFDKTEKAKDGLTWTHVSNLKFWDEPIAKLYSVESIPATFILDEVYQLLKEDFEEEKANRLFALLGRIAIATDEEFDQILKEQYDIRSITFSRSYE